jgi:DNA modification methylase
VGLSERQIIRIIDDIMAKLPECHEPPESLQYTNHWDFDGCDSSYGSKYPGRLPGQIIENLLWYYTEPFDVVLDPMAGSGTTIDVCKAMYRRYLAYDINPIESKGIKFNDITNGLPERDRKDKLAKLIVLDPPYSIELKGNYTNKDTDLSNISVEQFYIEIDKLAVACKKELHKDGVVAFMMSALKKDNVVTDLTFECCNIFIKQGYKLIERICDPYKNATSMTDFWIDDAKKNKRMLRDYRDILILTVK